MNNLPTNKLFFRERQNFLCSPNERGAAGATTSATYSSSTEINIADLQKKMLFGEISPEEFFAKLIECGVEFTPTACKNNPEKVTVMYKYNGEKYFIDVDKSMVPGTSRVPGAGLQTNMTDADIRTTIDTVIYEFASGNMTYDEARQELKAAGINVSALKKDDNDATQSYIEFKYKGVEYCVACNTKAINDGEYGLGGKDINVWPQEAIKSLNFTDEQLKTYFQEVAWKQGEKGALYYRAKSNWPEGITNLRELSDYLKNTTTTRPTFDRSELSGLRDLYIQMYFEKLPNGKFAFNEAAIKADFPDKQITTLDQLLEAIETQKVENKTTEKVIITINHVIYEFASGNMTYDEASQQLKAVGIDVSPLKKDDNDATQSYIEFKYKGIEYCVTCRTEAINDGKKGLGGNEIGVWSQEEIKSLNFRSGQLKIYFQEVAWKQGEEGALYYRANSNWPEGVTTPRELKTFLDEPPKIATFNKSQLSEFSAEDIEKYFVQLPNEKYGFNFNAIKADFPDKNITTLDQLKEAIEAQKVQEKEQLTKLVNKYIDVWVQDFTDGYTRWGLNSAPTADEIATFRKKLQNACDQNRTSLEALQDKSEASVKSWVRQQCDSIIKEIKNARESANAPASFSAADITQFGADGAKYFIKNSDGSFMFNEAAIKADFPDKQITTLEELKKAIEELKKQQALELLKGAAAIGTSADKLRNPVADVAEYIASECKSLIDHHKTLQVTYNFDANGSIQFNKGSDAEKVFNTIFDRLKSKITRKEPEALKNIGGEAMLKKLLQSAWAVASSGISNNTPVNTNDFIEKVMKNLDGILAKVTTNPEYLNYYTNSCYKDKSLTSNLSYMDSDNPVKLWENYRYAKKYDTGEMHLDDDMSDKKFQASMNKLLENIYKKYPHIDKDYLKELFYKAQENALTKNDFPYGMDTNSTKMSALVDLVLYHFDKLFKADAMNKLFAERTEDLAPRQTSSSQTAEQNNNIKDGASGIIDSVEDVAGYVVSVCEDAIDYAEKIHTEFGMDRNGNIVFQEANTRKVFDTILEKLKSQISRDASDALEKLGGESALKQLLQVAWITTYNSFYSAQNNNTRDFVNKVMANLKIILNKLQTNPELMEVFMTRTSYADSSVTNGLPHYNTQTTYGNDESIFYKGNVTIFADGSIHLSDTNDDNDYQTTMNALLKNLLDKYPSISGDKITDIFHKAQYRAIKALQDDVFDCPYGTARNDGRVEDTTKNWRGQDNRKGDKYYIDMDQIVQMTLYYFDKIMYAELLE